MGINDNYRDVQCCVNCKHSVSISAQTYIPDDYECDGKPISCYMVCDKYKSSSIKPVVATKPKCVLLP